MPGPIPKPDDRRQRQNTRPELPTTAPGPAPDPPAGLLKTTRDQWETYWRSSLARYVDQDTDRPAIERLFTLYDERERALQGYRKSRLVKGSQGQPVLNPLARLMSTLDSEIRQLEDRLGLNPKARATLGITFGEAARSLADLNRALTSEVSDGEEEEDPRLRAI